MLTLLKTPGDIIGNAVIYLTTMIAGTLIVTAYNMAAAILRVFGDGKSPLFAMVIAALMNVGLDFLFVLVFHWGVFGAAIASVTAQLFSFLFCLVRIRKIAYVRFEKGDWKFDGKMAKKMLLFGLPIALQIGFHYLMIASAGLIILYLIHVYRNALQALGNSFWSMISGFAECAVRILMAKAAPLALGTGTLYFVEPAAWVGALLFIMIPYYRYQRKLLS